MKFLIKNSELVSHGKKLSIIKLSKRLTETAKVTISVSEQFSVTGPGFRHDMDCQAIDWGTVGLPYKLWRHLIEELLPSLKDDEITISAEMVEIVFGGAKIIHPEIEVRRLDRLALEIPPDAKPIEIVKFALTQDIRKLRGSVVWTTVKSARDQVRNHIEKANSPLRRYGVEFEDLAVLVAKKLGIRNPDRFINFIFTKY